MVITWGELQRQELHQLGMRHQGLPISVPDFKWGLSQAYADITEKTRTGKYFFHTAED